MTKAELIRKVAKRAGIPDQEAKFFFELFLKKASMQLHPGETIKLKGLGYFQLKKGRIKKTGNAVDNEIYSEFIIFYSLDPDTYEENLIFNVPMLEETKYNFIDSFFSLSFGKTVIPLKNSSSSEYFIAPTGVELRRLAEIKSEKLIQEFEVVERYFKGSENHIFEQDENDTSRIELDWNKSEETKQDPENLVSWNFGSDLDKEIEEESILDTGSEDNPDVTWDFGDHLSKKTSEENNEGDEYQQVKSIHSEYNIPDVESSWDSGGEEILKESITEEFDNNASSLNTEVPEDKSLTEEEPYVKQEDSSGNDEDFVLPGYLEEEELIPEPISYEDRTPSVRKKRGLGLFLILSVVILVSAALLFYFKILNTKINPVKVINIPAKTIPSNAVIQRSYEIPVTYPYDTTIKLNEFHDPYNITAPPTPSEPTQNNEGTKISGTEKEQSYTSTDITGNQQNQTLSDASEKVKEFIYKKGNKYLVQISSWHGKSFAERHAATFKAKGLVTEIVKVDLYGDSWYRVRVGYFNSIDEAERFFQNNR